MENMSQKHWNNVLGPCARLARVELVLNALGKLCDQQGGKGPTCPGKVRKPAKNLKLTENSLEAQEQATAFYVLREVHSMKPEGTDLLQK
jgi:hypothetical protein